ncbi:MAG: QcrA and Rieske domain-containing protein [Candidatus Binatia bacterium]
MANDETSLAVDHGRRNLLNWFLSTTAGAFLVSVIYPLSRFMIPPEVEESTSSTVTLAIKPNDVKANSGQIFRFGSQAGILVKDTNGELKAFSAVCTHLACIVQYRSDISHVWCACHNGHFDLNGRNVEGPPPKPLEQFVVNVRADQIVVSKRG